MPQEFEPPASETSAPRVETPHDPATQRVTPEELSAALAALEGRPSRPLPAAGTAPSAAHVPDTLTLGEAADALNLYISPEELWREVQQQRARKEQAEREQAERERSAYEQAPPPSFQQVPPLQTSPAFEGLAGRDARFGAAPRGGLRRWIGIALGTFLVIRLLSGHGHHVPLSFSTSASVSSMSAGHNLAVNADAQNCTVNAAGGVLTINGDADTITVNGPCDSVIVNGDADTVRLHGSVKSVTFNGDASNATYPPTAAPSVSYNGDANSAHPE